MVELTTVPGKPHLRHGIVAIGNYGDAVEFLVITKPGQPMEWLSCTAGVHGEDENGRNPILSGRAVSEAALQRCLEAVEQAVRTAIEEYYAAPPIKRRNVS